MYSAVVTVPRGLKPYEVHQFLYGYFPQHGRKEMRPYLFRRASDRCLLVSRIPPTCPYQTLQLEDGRTYSLEALLAPTYKRRDRDGRLIDIPMLENQERRDWFSKVCARFGGEVGFCQWHNRDKMQFRHSNGCVITLYPVQVKAMVFITDATRFNEMVLRGLGRGKAFGYGLLVFHELMFSDELNKDFLIPAQRTND